jgi:hypothetical protein
LPSLGCVSTLRKNHAGQRLRSLQDPLGVPPGTKEWEDVPIADVPHLSIGQDAFKAVPGSDPHPPILDRDKEQQAVVLTALADLPLIEDGHGVLFDRLGRSGWDNKNGDLGRRLLPDIQDQPDEPLSSGSAQNPNQVNDRSFGGRDLGPGGDC